MSEQFELKSLRDTFSLATRLAFSLKPGMVLTLEGDLGAGKTTLVQALAQAYGIKRMITSPTFALVSEYPMPNDELFVHIDLYRLASPEGLLDIGFNEYLENGARVVIEWPERAGNYLQKSKRINVALSHGNDENSRMAEITYVE